MERILGGAEGLGSELLIELSTARALSGMVGSERRVASKRHHPSNFEYVPPFPQASDQHWAAGTPRAVKQCLRLVFGGRFLICPTGIEAHNSMAVTKTNSNLFRDVHCVWW